MAKRRSCRRTAQEDRNHERAVKLRKMTDEQLCQYIDREVEAAYQRGCNKSGKVVAEGHATVSDFLTAISSKKIPGIGAVTINKLMKEAMEHGFIE